MATEIRMPQLSDTMDAGKILSWNKQEGDAVDRGDILAEVETDKANLEIECFQKGTLLKIVIPVDETAQVGEIIAYIGEAGEAVPQSGSNNGSATNGAAPSEASGGQTEVVAPTSADNGSPSDAVAHSGASPSQQAGSDRIKASPLARKLADQHGVDLRQVTGSGPDRRIVKKDIEQAIGQQAPSVPAPQPATPVQDTRPSTPPSALGEGSLTPLSKMRATIGRRMQESVVQAPHFYTTVSVRMDAAMTLRAGLKEDPAYKGISLNHLVMKAVALSLRAEPRVNNAVKNDQLYTPAGINIGVIVAIEDGLLIPVVRNVDTLSLRDVVFEARAAVERARAGRPNSTDLSGGTFSISNMGMFEVENFTALINPGQGAILAVSSILEQPVVEDGRLVVGSVMKATLSVDHRIIDGVMAGTFLKHFKKVLEVPGLLLA